MRHHEERELWEKEKMLEVIPCLSMIEAPTEHMMRAVGAPQGVSPSDGSSMMLPHSRTEPPGIVIICESISSFFSQSTTFSWGRENGNRPRDKYSMRRWTNMIGIEKRYHQALSFSMDFFS